jgi:hypothetical protein
MWTPHLAALALSFILPIQVVIAQENPKCLQGKAATQGLGDDPKELQAALEDPITRLCEHKPIGKDVVSYASTNFMITIKRDEGPQNDKECIQAIQKIIELCIVGQNANGGTINANKNVPTYTVSTQPVGDLEARAKRPKKPKTPAKPPAKPPVKPTAKTSTKPIATPTQKASSKVQSSAAKTSSVAKPTPTKTCKRLYSELLASSKQAALAEKREETLKSRQGFGGSRVNVEKRWTKKSGKACGFDLDALNYPQKKEMVNHSILLFSP